MTRDIREWEQGNGKSLSETRVVCCGERPASFSCISLWMGASVRDIPAPCWDWHLFPLLLFVVCQHGSMPIPNTKWKKKRGNVDIRTGEALQDVTAAVTFWSHLTRELLVKRLVRELDRSDPATGFLKLTILILSLRGCKKRVSVGLGRRSERWPRQQKYCWMCTVAQCTEPNSSLQQ